MPVNSIGLMEWVERHRNEAFEMRLPQLLPNRIKNTTAGKVFMISTPTCRQNHFKEILNATLPQCNTQMEEAWFEEEWFEVARTFSLSVKEGMVKPSNDVLAKAEKQIQEYVDRMLYRSIARPLWYRHTFTTPRGKPQHSAYLGMLVVTA